MTDALDGIESWPIIDMTGDDATEVPALATWPGVELVAVGEWSLSTGIANFTATDLAEACAAARCPAVGQPVIKLGHHDPRFDGEPAIGWIGAMRLNETQTKLVGDFTGMPGWLAAILPSAYPERSIEGCWDFTCQIGHVHPFVITAVALLGVTPPGVGTIGSLNDVAALYGIDPPAEPAPAEPAEGAAQPRTFRILATPGETPMPPQTRPADAAGVVPTVDDIRREYYEDADWSAWIVEVQLTADGPVLIVIDDSNGQLVRVPVSLKDGGMEFGEAVPVLVSYVDAPKQTAAAAAAAFPPGRNVAAAWPDRAASRAGMIVAGAIARHTTPTDDGTWDGGDNETNLPTEEGDASDYRQCYAWVDPDGDPDTKAAYKFPHHMVSSDGSVGAASTVACSAGIGVLNGGRGGADIPDADVQGIYAHLAGHLTDADMTPPELAAAGPEPQIQPAGGGDAGPLDDPEVEGATRHGEFDGEHEHPHADGQGGVHYHLHSHAKSGKHDHPHDVSEADAGAGPAVTNGRSADVEFSDAQMAGFRTALGKKDGEEVTADEIATAMGRLATTPVIDASAPETPAMSEGTYLVDGSIIQDWRQRAAAGDAAVTELRIRERDTVLAAAVGQGKFPQSRLEHYQALWDRDPEGTRKHVDALAAGLVPMNGPRGSNPGYDPDMPGDFEGQAAYRQLYPEDAGRR
jgi:hypothetical protein